MEFAQNLRRICQQKGTSPTRLMQQMGFSTSKVTLWNNGSLPKPHMIEMIAEKLGVQPYELFSPNRNTVDSLSQDEQDIIRIYRSIGRKEQHQFMTYCYSLEDNL